MCYGVFMIKNKHFNKKEWQKLSATHLIKLDELTGQIAKHNYLVQLGVVSIPSCNKRYANNNQAIARGFSLRLVKLGHR